MTLPLLRLLTVDNRNVCDVAYRISLDDSHRKRSVRELDARPIPKRPVSLCELQYIK